MKREMPQRPRQHQLESESRAALRSAIPSVWVYRDLDQDYGIDAEAEIFDRSGSATGRKFLVQVKSTDEPEVQKALRLWFSLAKGRYYESLQLPVLIVRYHAPTKRLFTRWFHSLDPYNGEKTSAGITFHLRERDAWSESTADRLAHEVEAYQEVRSSRIGGPISFALSIAGDTIHGVPALQISLLLREAARKVSHFIPARVKHFETPGMGI